MKNPISIRIAIMAFAVLGIFIAGCSGKSNKEDSHTIYRTLEDFNGKTVAIGTGSAQEAIIEKEYPQINLMRLEMPTDMIQALRSNLCEAVVLDGHMLKFYTLRHSELVLSDIVLCEFPIGAGFTKGSDLKSHFDEFLEKIKADGTYGKIYDNWINNAITAELPQIEFDNSKKPIRIATCSTTPPMSFIRNGELVGFEVELAMRFGEYMRRPVELCDMYFSGIIQSVVGGTVDFALSSLSITEERAKSIDFSIPYYDGNIQLCIRRENSPQDDRTIYRSLDDLATSKVATYTGSSQERALEQKYPKMQIQRMDDDLDMLKSLVHGMCEAVVLDDYTMKYYSKQVGGVEIIDSFGDLSFGIAFKKGKNTELREQFNRFIGEIESNGTLQQMKERWIEDPDNSPVPEIEMPKEGIPVKISIAAGAAPFQFYKNGVLTGFEIELCQRFAAYIQRPVEFQDSDWASLLTSIAAGTNDMAISALNITPERADAVDFSVPYYVCTSLVGIRAENSENYVQKDLSGKEDEVKAGMLASLKRSIQRNILEEERYKMILSGLKLTAFISLMAAIIGTLLGGIICWMRMHSNIVLRSSANAYINVMRGTPVLVLLMFMFYVVLAGTSTSATWVSIITFAMNFAAYSAEIFRSSIEGIDKGQTEAGLSLGYTPSRTFIKFILPQAFATALPVYKGETISLVKTTSIVGFIAVQDLTKVGDIIRSRTFDAFFPLIMVAVLYFVLSWVFATALDFIGPKKK